MLKYIVYSAALKAFSCGSPMRRLYRKLGNHFGAKKRVRGDIPEFYLDRIKNALDLAGRYSILKNGGRILEVGTGWLHWEAITLSLFFDVQAVLFDVWDNRQLAAFKHHLRQFQQKLDRMFPEVTEELRLRANDRINIALGCTTFEQLYKAFGFKYVVESSGSLAGLSDESFDLVVSAGVLEHIEDDIIAPLIHDTYRVLKPGGWALHNIDMNDHLSYYDSGMHEKLYISYSERMWKLVCENKVQYINRLQRSQWLDIFRSSGFNVVTQINIPVKGGVLMPAEQFKKMSAEDLDCAQVTVLLRKPEVTSLAK
jgi:SAM-dependent methyltransferase